MKYWGPINSPGGIFGNDGYVDGNPSIGQEGSIPTFRTFEQTMRELQNFVVKSGLTPDDAMDGIQVAQSVQAGKVNYALDVGTANALVATLDPIPAALAAGLHANIIKISSANTTTSPTLNVNGFGPAPIVDRRGSSLVPGDLPASGALQLLFDGVSWRYLGVVMADLGGLGTLTNVKMLTTTTRVSMQGLSGNSYSVTPWTPTSYVKKSETSNIVVMAALLSATQGATFGAGASLVDLVVGSATTTVNASNSQLTPAESAGATVVNTLLTGQSSGSKSISARYYRTDAQNWHTIFSPNSSDAAYFGNSSVSSIMLGEIEP